MTDDQNNYEYALSLQKDGKYKTAIEVARKISHPGARGGIFIDCGFGTRKPSLIREGILLFEGILEKGNSEISKASLLYNIGNGYYSIYKLKQLKGGKVIPPNDDDLRSSKKAYRKALFETKDNPPNLHSQIYVNYGNCLSALGRSFEAINAYNDALVLEPQNGMAAGNLGIELVKIANITEKYRHHYLQASSDLLTRSLSSEMHLSYGGIETRRGMETRLNQIRLIIDAHKNGIEPLRKVNLSESKEHERNYLLFCLTNRLFLNVWAGDQDVSPALTDEIGFGSLTTSVGDLETVPKLLQILNEIKEAFSAARYLYYLSQTNSKELNSISRFTSYFDFAVETQHGLAIGLCKSAYTRSFDILDKVARIVNYYFNIGNVRDSFWDVFAERQSRGENHEMRFVARPSIISTKNYSLYGLSDLCIDYFESEHVDFKSIDTRRNLLTHDYLVVTNDSSEIKLTENSITKEELYRQTLSVLHLAKYAILYVVCAVHISEDIKQTKGKTFSIKYKQAWGN